jgi:hypothetical protein
VKFCRTCGKEIKPEEGIGGERRKVLKPHKGPERRNGLDRRLGGRPPDPE